MSEPVPAPGLPRMTFDAFLAWERSIEDRHEFVDGVVYAMSGGTRLHDLLATNVTALLWNAARAGNTCQVYAQGPMVRIRDDAFYPDVAVVCDPTDRHLFLAHRPCLLVEVLSPSSVRHDRERKLAKYQALPSLRAYLIVSQEYRHIERHWRDAADAPWQREEITAERGEVPVPCPTPGTLFFAEIYRLTTVPDRPPLRRVRERAHETESDAGLQYGDSEDEAYTAEPV